MLKEKDYVALYVNAKTEILNDISNLQQRIKDYDAYMKKMDDERPPSQRNGWISQSDVDLYDMDEMIKWNSERLVSYKANLIHYVDNEMYASM